jgi:hypothetical protein
LSDGKVKFLTDEQALTLQPINGLRDSAQHHLVDISEGHLYLQAQSGITLHRDLRRTVFDEDLRDLLPDRVLPIATQAPLDPVALFTEEIEEIAGLLRPGRRQGTEAVADCEPCRLWMARFKASAYPSEYQLRKMGSKISAGATSIDDLFPGIAAVGFVAESSGSNINLRITKREGIPVKLVQEGSPDASVVGVNACQNSITTACATGTWPPS